MDTVKFIEERDRMYEVARQAPSLCYRHEKSAEEIVREVEEWSAAHPLPPRVLDAGGGVMERLTKRSKNGGVYFPEELVGVTLTPDNATIHRLLWCLAAYEDTGLTPGDIKELLDMAVSKTDKVLRLEEELHTIKNELCQYCGKYKQAHEGACDGCKWREV